MLKNIYKLIFAASCTQKKNRVMWVKVPMTCKSREDKVKLIGKINIDLEHNIKII